MFGSILGTTLQSIHLKSDAVGCLCGSRGRAPTTYLSDRGLIPAWVIRSVSFPTLVPSFLSIYTVIKAKKQSCRQEYEHSSPQIQNIRILEMPHKNLRKAEPLQVFVWTPRVCHQNPFSYKKQHASTLW